MATELYSGDTSNEVLITNTPESWKERLEVINRTVDTMSEEEVRAGKVLIEEAFRKYEMRDRGSTANLWNYVSGYIIKNAKTKHFEVWDSVIEYFKGAE